MQVKTANSLAVLSRQQLNLPEYNSFKKKKFSLDNIRLNNRVLAVQNTIGDAFL